MNKSFLTIMDSGRASADCHMKRDYQILSYFLSNNSIINHYDWEGPSATYGCLLRPEKYLDLNKVKEIDLSLAKRPTGGGIVFHLWDLAFSFFLPATHPVFSLNTLDNYAIVNKAVISTVRDFLGSSTPVLLPQEPLPLDDAARNFCMAKPTKYDVMIDGRKVGGAAQRRTKLGLLHQGTISIVSPDFSYLEQVLLPGTAVIEAMRQNAYSLLSDGATPMELEEARRELREGLNRNLALSIS
jgi:lipoate-protein ligase A